MPKRRQLHVTCENKSEILFQRVMVHTATIEAPVTLLTTGGFVPAVSSFLISNLLFH
jgi:hypothetical protein